MAAFFKKKSDKSDEQERQPPLPEEKKTPPDEESALKPEKKPRKPLFVFKKKPKEEPETVEAEPEEIIKKAEAVEEKPVKKALFGKKGPGKPKPEKAKKPKAKKPKAKKTKAEKPKAKGRGGFGPSKLSPVGLDLGRSSITAVRVRHQTGGSVLVSAAMDRMPDGLIQEGEVKDVDGLAETIRTFWKNYRLKGRKVNLGLANQKIVVRTLEFPVLDEKELRSAIEFQAQDYIPIPIEEAVFDFHVLGRFSDEGGIEKQKVLVVAAQKQMVMDFIDAVKKARLTVEGIDLDAFAMLRSLVSRSFLDEGVPAGKAVAVANIASDVTNLVVDVGGEPQFTRIIPFGGDDFTRAVQDQAGVTFDEAELLKARVGLAGTAGVEEGETAPGGPGEGGGALPPAEEPTGIVPPAEEPPEGPEVISPEPEEELRATTAARRALEVTADVFADEIRRSLDYYMSQEESVPVGRMLLSGGGALLVNLDAHLSQMFPFTVELGNPLTKITENRSDLSDGELQALSPHLAIAIGLALEDEE